MDLQVIFKNFNKKKILIIGDSMIDTYMWGEINRQSPEAPVNIVNVNMKENRLGGAANVALNLKALGATPILCSVIGSAETSKLFFELMKKEGLSIEGILIDKERKTTTKTRVIANNKHQIRFDEEDTSPIKQDKELMRLITLCNNIDIILMQDYNKGVLTTNLIKNVIQYANSNNIPTIVDPKKENFTAYKGCTVFKPNLSEIKSGMNINLNINKHELIKATSKLKESLNANMILLTLSENGIFINSNNLFHHLKAFKRNIIDISGAGDTVVSIAALCLASNIDDMTLAMLCNLAGGLVCENVGVVSINKKKLLSEALKHIN